MALARVRRCGADLLEEKKLVGVKECAAEGWEAFLFDEGFGGGEFVLRRLTLIDELVGGGDVLGFGGELFGLFEKEGAVEEVQCLEWRGAACAAWADLTAIRRVEGGEDGVGLHAEFERVDHAAVILALEVARRR